MASTATTALLIAGMHRSGTSALAGALAKLGVPLGDHLLGPGSDNPKGYWEHQDIVAVHERLLAALGSRWDDVRALPAEWMTCDATKQAEEAIDSLVTRDFAGEPLWAVKDPRICRLLPLWLQILRRRKIRPVVLIMARKPSEVSASIEARNHWRTPVGELLWLRYVTEAEAASRTVSRGVVVYDDLLADPVSTVSKALNRVSVCLTPPTRGRELLVEFVDGADRHHAHDPSRKPDTEFAAVAEALYESMVAIAHGEDEWTSLHEIAARFERLSRREGAVIDALAGMIMELAVLAESRWVEIQTLTSKLNAQIRWSDEAKAKHETLQAENAELSSTLTGQLRWAKEAQADRETLRADNAELQSRLTAQIRLFDETQAQRDSLLKDQEVLSTELRETELKSALARDEFAKEMRDSQNERTKITGELGNVKGRLRQMEADLVAVYASTSWKLTKPLRAVSKALMRKAHQSTKQDRHHQ